MNRQFYRKLLAVLLISGVCCTTSHARLSPPAPDSKPLAPTKEDESPQAEFEHACRLMTRGSSFNSAIVNLRAAITSDPKNAKYHNALACALVDRAASIAYAADKIDTYKQLHEHYTRDLARWQAAQQGIVKPVDTDPEISQM